MAVRTPKISLKADLLAAGGFDAASVTTGTVGWVVAGYPVEVGL